MADPIPSDELRRILSMSYDKAKNMGHEYLTPEHLLFVALEHGESRQIVDECHADPDAVRRDIEEDYFNKYLETVQDSNPTPSSAWERMTHHTLLHLISVGKYTITPADVLVSIYDMDDSFASYYLKKAGIQRIRLLETVSHRPNKGEVIEQNNEDAPETEIEDFPEDSNVPDRKKTDVLKKFAVNVTARAAAGELEPLIGREDILERTVQVLSRRLKNNPVHVGEPGVGKTAITEGLACRIVEGKVPGFLKECQIWSLDIGSLLAGTRYRGDFEDRIKKVLTELENQKNVILYIDEIHTIIGAGSTSGGTMDASNLLKPSLMSGKFRCIGSTTYTEFKKFFEKDHALARRFQRIEVPETTREETCGILRGLRGAYETHHGVSYEDEALTAAVDLSDQFLNEKHLPDKAIDLIDEAGAWKRLQYESETSVSEAETDAPITHIPVINVKDIERVLAKIARIPERTVSAGETDNLMHLKQNLLARIFGQAEAVNEVAMAIKRARAGFRRPDKPVACFLFVGPTGVGKTELARSLADELGITLHRFDMSEYQEKHTVSRLIGSPPGYVGYDDGGLLTDAVRKTPHAVVLLDEIEKAHQDIFNILLQVMDYATLTDNMGRKADFRNVVLVMTSNAGARDIGRFKIGFGGGIVNNEAMDDAVDRAFSPEFRNRLDKVVKFNHLTMDIMENIVRKEIDMFITMLTPKGIELNVTDNAIRWLAEKGRSVEFGARNIARLVEDKIKSFFVDQVLFGSLSSGGKAVVDVENGEMAIQTTAKHLTND